jgi:GTP-binding protein Era
MSEDRPGFKSGFVAVVGRANAGKSTLVNAMLGRKVTIVSAKPQTTRLRVHGILNSDDAQIVMIDTPGLQKAESGLGRQMMHETQQALEGIDSLALIVDATELFGRGDQFSLKWIENFHGPVDLLLNKIDRMPKHDLLPLMERYGAAYHFAEIIPISAWKGDGLSTLLNVWKSRLKEGPRYFPEDQFTDQPERFMAAEFVREKVIQETKAEVPHAVMVMVDNFEEGETLTRIEATIYVEREGQKGIVIGKGGAMLKKIGTAARKDIEKLVGSKVFLGLRVKVLENWRQRTSILQQMDWRREAPEES